MSFQEAAFLNHKNLIAQTFDDRCTVIVQESGVNAETHRTEKTMRTVYTDTPCRLSFSSLSSAKPGEAAQAAQAVTLFTGPDVKIPPGSRVIVDRVTGETSNWKQSGVPASYITHCEYPLDIYEDYT